MGGTRNKVLTDISKEIWDFLLLKEITITVEYLLGVLNQEADFQSRSMKDSNKWKLKPQIFQALCNLRGTPDIGLFASRVSHQLSCYISWKLDPFSKGRDAFQRSWKYQKGYDFAPFSLIGRVLRKVQTSISAYHDPIDGFSVGKHPHVCSLLKGIFNERPPIPRYTFIWDVQKVLTYLSTLGMPEHLSDKMLTHKTTMFIALTSSNKAHEICS